MPEITTTSIENRLRQMEQELRAMRDLLSHIPMRDDMHGSEISCLRACRAASGYIGQLDDVLAHSSQADHWGVGREQEGVTGEDPKAIAYRVRGWALDTSTAIAGRRREYMVTNSDNTAWVVSGWGY